MKRAIVLSTVVFLVMATIMVANAWGPDIRLTTNDSVSVTTVNNAAKCIAVSGDTVYLVWQDTRDSAVPEVYFKRSIDNGGTWSTDTRLSISDTSWSGMAALAISGNVLHVVWQDLRDTVPEMYYKRSEDAGGTWSTDTRLTIDTFYSVHPAVAASGTNVHLVWDDQRDTNTEIYYKRSTNAGAAWGVDTRITANDSLSYYPSVAASGNNVHIVWCDERDGNQEIYYRRSVNNGTDWGTATRLTNNDSVSMSSCIAVSGDTVHVVWLENRDDNYEIYYKRSTDNGTTWGTDTRLTNAPGYSTDPTITVFGSAVHVAWIDTRDGNEEVYYKYSMDNGTGWIPDTRLTNNSSESLAPNIAAFGEDIHVAWADYRNVNSEIYYKHASEVRPDALIKNPADSLYTGSDIYNADATDQSVFQTAQLLATATYQVMLENDARIPDTFRITGTAGNSQWLVGYFDALTGGNNITSLVTGAGWNSGEIVPGANRQIRIEVIPLDTVPGDTFYDVTLTATSIRDTVKLDAVKATTLIEIIPAGVENRNPVPPFEYFLSSAALSKGAAVIRYGLPSAATVSLKVYDISGKIVEVLLDGRKEAGVYEMRLDAKSKLPSGVFFVRMESGSFSKIQKILLVK